MDFRQFLREFEIAIVGFSYQKVGIFLTVQEAITQFLAFFDPQKTHK